MDRAVVAFYLNVIGFIFLIPFALWKRKELAQSTLWRIYMLRALLTASSQILLVYAYNNMEFAQVSAITLLYPLMCSAASCMIFREKVGIRRASALVTGFIGAVIIINPSYHAFNHYSLYVILVTFLWVAYDLATSKWGKTESLITQSFFVMLFVTLFSALPASFKDFTNVSPLFWENFHYFGLIVVFYFVSGIAAIMHANELSVVMPFYFLVLVVSTAIGYYVFSESVSLSTSFGATIILGSTSYIAYREYQIKKSMEKQKSTRLI
ncbi:eamA-like transporter family protein [Neorickettsia helminthoeca str. Oregon]|uniref:S-adenosylmethionine uptake transporter n=2 Tax=Neorickettsia helminthoeca TaxID=33994 RepID=X5HJ19_9RICK|nr:eamA-like transporter family protein [Neorickettsia helminthoeca str. Oregon]